MGAALTDRRITDVWRPPAGCDWWQLRARLDDARIRYDTFVCTLPGGRCALRVHTAGAALIAGGWLVWFDRVTGSVVDRHGPPGVISAVVVPASGWEFVAR